VLQDVRFKIKCLRFKKAVISPKAVVSIPSLMSELARKDLMTCLGVWLALEIVGFGLLPAIVSASSPIRIDNWFLVSLPLGIGGAFFIANGTQLALNAFEQESQTQKRLMQVLSVLTSWAGLLGIGFPLLVIATLIGVELFTKLQG
jgi:hypothetical protein